MRKLIFLLLMAFVFVSLTTATDANPPWVIAHDTEIFSNDAVCDCCSVILSKDKVEHNTVFMSTGIIDLSNGYDNKPITINRKQAVEAGIIALEVDYFLRL